MSAGAARAHDGPTMTAPAGSASSPTRGEGCRRRRSSSASDLRWRRRPKTVGAEGGPPDGGRSERVAQELCLAAVRGDALADGGRRLGPEQELPDVVAQARVNPGVELYHLRALIGAEPAVSQLCALSILLGDQELDLADR